MRGNFLVMAALVLSSCATVPENHYFTLSYSLLEQHRLSSKTGLSLRLRPFDIGPAYDTERLVYRYSPYEFQYYNFMLWATKPQKMIGDLVLRHLRHSGLFAQVEMELSDNPPDLELSGEVISLEELDSGDEWYAHLAMNLWLRAYRSEKILWSKNIDVKKRVYNKAPVYVVKALSELLENEMHQACQEMAEALAGFAPDRKE